MSKSIILGILLFDGKLLGLCHRKFKGRDFFFSKNILVQSRKYKSLLQSIALVTWKKTLLNSVHITGYYHTSITMENLQLSSCLKCLNLAWGIYS